MTRPTTQTPYCAIAARSATRPAARNLRSRSLTSTTWRCKCPAISLIWLPIHRHLGAMAQRQGPGLIWKHRSWVSGMNSGILPTVLSGYQKASNTFSDLQPASCFRSMPASEVERVRSDAATIQLVDGAAQNAMQMIGTIRANALGTTNTIRNIQSDSFSSNPDLNTEVSVLNKVNATNVLALENAQDTNKLLVALLEQQTILAKQARDSATNITNADIGRRLNSVQFGQQLAGGIGQALNHYRLP